MLEGERRRLLRKRMGLERCVNNLILFIVEIGPWDLPAISSIVAKVRFVWSPLHSRALIPKSEVKKDRGKNLIPSEMIDKKQFKKGRVIHNGENSKHHHRTRLGLGDLCLPSCHFGFIDIRLLLFKIKKSFHLRKLA